MYKYLLLIILIIIFYILRKKNIDFYNDYYSYNDKEKPPSLSDTTFKNLIKESNMDLDTYDDLIAPGPSDAYDNLPTLTFQSFESCPNLYSLFQNLKDSNNEGGEGLEAIKFRNECEKIFYNSDSFIKIEHPIIDVNKVDVNKVVNNGSSAKQDFEFSVGSKKLYYNMVGDGTNFCHMEKNIKQINFGVKSDFTMEDIYRFVDYCFTQVCFGMIYIEDMKLLDNHYRVLPSPHHKGSFFILPERIRYQVAKEGKYYTRAKCNTTGLNIIVLFGNKFPEKFDYINKPKNNLCNVPSFL